MKQMCMCNVVSAAEKRCAACNHAVVCVTYTGVEGSLCLFRPTWLALAGVVDVLLLLCLLCPALNARLRRTNIDECRWACTGEVKRRRNLPRPLGGGQPHLCIMLPLDMNGLVDWRLKVETAACFADGAVLVTFTRAMMEIDAVMAVIMIK